MIASSVVIFLCLHVAEPRWRPYAQQKKQFVAKAMPQQLDKNQLAQLKLPNNIFCAQMEQQTAGMYILMPWWYNHCQDLKEKRAKKYKNGNAFYKPIYKSVLDRLQWLRQHKRTSASKNNVKWIRAEFV